MILEMMAVYDSKARAFLPPFFVTHVDVGMRHIAHGVNKDEHPFNQNPTDYIVFHLGTFRDENAAFSIFTEPKNLGLVQQLQRQAQLGLVHPSNEGRN